MQSMVTFIYEHGDTLTMTAAWIALVQLSSAKFGLAFKRRRIFPNTVLSGLFFVLIR